MNETKKKITEYTKMMAGIKEKVVATLILFVVSAVMMTTVSFAWFTMSRNPEVTGVSTTVATNGNLEIALCPADGSLPAESSVGDAKLPILQKNITWGNLINLSADEYGLENMILRPAVLNVNGDLLESPLKAAKYDEDGRVIGYISDFGYAMWQTATSTKPAYFAVKEGFGVRALASLSYKDVGGDMAYYEMVSNVESLQEEVIGKYTELTGTKYIDSIAAIMGDFLSAKFGSSDGEFICEYSDVETLYGMLGLFVECYELEAKAMAGLMNLQLFIVQGEKYKAIDEDTFLNNLSDIEKILTDNKLYKGTVDKTGKIIYDEESFSIQELSVFVADFNTVRNDFAKMEAILADETNKDNKAVNWNNSLKDENGKTIASMNDIVMHLVNINTCTVNGTPVSSVGMSNVIDVVKLGRNNDAVIKEGILKRFEDIIGNRLGGGKGVTTSIPATLGITVSVKATIKTAAPLIGYFEYDFEDVKSLSAGAYKDLEYIADDTYGFAVDFFVRTNADESFLTLQGNLLTKTEEVMVMGKDADGNEVNIYTIVVSTEEGEGTLDVYTKNNSWYNAYSHDEMDVSEYEPKLKIETITTIVGYEGDNRVWNDEIDKEFLSINSTTQGSGSCYVFYTDDPIEQERCIALLQHMKVVFIDEEGIVLANGSLKTDSCYAEAGRIIVPLVVDEDPNLCVGTDAMGNDIYAITPLEKNIPKRITALVYLDGGTLTNEDVLASADIHGRLNIQFGSTVLNSPIDNEELYNKEIVVTGSVTKDSFDFDDGDSLTTTMEIKIEGSEPAKVTAFFIRILNSTQGTREKEVTLLEGSDGVWRYDYTFDAPGTYILRSVFVDGIERELSNTEKPIVVVEGFNISSISWGPGTSEYSYMSASEFYSTSLTLKFATTSIDRMPSTVKGIFKKDDGSSVVVNFAYSTNGEWSGLAEFYSSGEYVLEYLLLDDVYNYLEESQRKTIKLSLGIAVKVFTDSKREFTLGDEGYDKDDILYMTVEVYNDAGELLRNLSDLSLTYYATTSSAITMYTPLVWDESKSIYKGEFIISNAGIFSFSNVNIAGNIISEAITSPKFNIIPPDAVSFDSAQASAYQFCLTGQKTATVTLNLIDATSPYIVPVFRNTWLESKSGGTPVYVYGDYVIPSGATAVLTDAATTDNDYIVCTAEIIIPKNDFSLYENLSADESIKGTQDGHWELYSVLVFNVYFGDDYDKKFYPWGENWDNNTDFAQIPDDQKLEFIIADINKDSDGDGSPDSVKSKVVSTVFVKNENQTIDGNIVKLDNTNSIGGDFILGATYDPSSSQVNRTALFMDSYTISNINISIYDFEGLPLTPDSTNKVSSLALKYELNSATTAGYGFYSRADGQLIEAVIDIPLSSSDGISFKQNEDKTITFAGQYSPSLTIKSGQFNVTVDDFSSTVSPYVIKQAIPGLRIYSKPPSVVVSGVNSVDSEDTEHGTRIDSNSAFKSFKDGGDIPEYTDYSATVYVICTKKTTCGKTQYLYNNAEPTAYVELKLSGIGEKISKAVLDFAVSGDEDPTVYMYTDINRGDITNSFSWDVDDSVCTRYIGKGTNNNTKKSIAGTISAKFLIVTTKDGNDYSFEITPITINNPY